MENATHLVAPTRWIAVKSTNGNGGIMMTKILDLLQEFSHQLEEESLIMVMLKERSFGPIPEISNKVLPIKFMEIKIKSLLNLSSTPQSIRFHSLPTFKLINQTTGSTQERTILMDANKNKLGHSHSDSQDTVEMLKRPRLLSKPT